MIAVVATACVSPTRSAPLLVLVLPTADRQIHGGTSLNRVAAAGLSLMAYRAQSNADRRHGA